jgi:hypothetical protein
MEGTLAENASGFLVTDRKGRAWDLRITFAGAKRIDASDFTAVSPLEFTILDPGPEGHQVLLKDLLTNRGLTMAVVFALVQPQVKENLELDPKTDYDAAEAEFLDGFGGLEIQNARYTFWRALADFHPDQAIFYLHALDEEIRLIEMQKTEVNAELPKMREQIDRQFRAMMTQGMAAFATELGGMSG